MCAVGPGPTVWDQLGHAAGAQRQPLHLQRTPQHLPHLRRPLAGHLHLGDAHRRAGHAPGRPPGGDRRGVVLHRAQGRAAHVDLLDGYVAEWIGARTEAEVTEAFEAADAAVAPVYTAADLVADPQVQALDMVTTVRGRATSGPVRMPGRAVPHVGHARSGPFAPGPSRDRRGHRRGADQGPGNRPGRGSRSYEPVASVPDREPDHAPATIALARRRSSAASRSSTSVGPTSWACRSHRTTPATATPSIVATATACVTAVGRPRPTSSLSAATWAPTSTRWRTSARTAMLHGGIDADDAQRGGRFMESGVHTIAPIAGRGVLLDVPGGTGTGRLRPRGPPPRRPRDHRGRARSTPSTPRAPRSDRATRCWSAPAGECASARARAYLGADSGVPGVSEAGAEWLAGHDPTAVGADTIAFEMLAGRRGPRLAARAPGAAGGGRASPSSRRSTSRGWPLRPDARVPVRAEPPEPRRSDRCARAPAGDRELDRR